MRFGPGCGCCEDTTPYPTGCDDCPSIPDTLYLTLTMSCAGYSADVITMTRFPALDGSGSIAYIGALPASCGSTTNYQTVTGCDNPYLDSIYLAFECQLGTPRVTVQLMCESGATYSGGAPVGQEFITCPDDLSPVNVTVTLGAAGTTTGECCEDQASPSGTAVITE